LLRREIESLFSKSLIKKTSREKKLTSIRNLLSFDQINRDRESKKGKNKKVCKEWKV